MVALPKRWVKEMGLQQGSEILITRPSLMSLLITVDIPKMDNGKQEAMLEVAERDSAEALFRMIVSLYIHGYSLISLKSINGSLTSVKKDAIKEMVRRHLIGTEGVADSKDRLSVHVLLGYSEVDVETALKKILLITTSMQKDVFLALENYDKNLAEGIIERDDEVDRFSLYVIRQLNMSINQGIFKEELLAPRDLLGYTLVVRTIERVADHISKIAREVTNLKEPLQKQIVEKLLPMNELGVNMVESAMLALFKRDHLGADQVIEKKKQFLEL